MMMCLGISVVFDRTLVRFGHKMTAGMAAGMMTELTAGMTVRGFDMLMKQYQTAGMTSGTYPHTENSPADMTGLSSHTVTDTAGHTADHIVGHTAAAHIAGYTAVHIVTVRTAGMPDFVGSIVR